MKHAITLSFMLVTVAASFEADAPTNSVRVYYIGNGVTDTIRYRSLAKLADSRGVKIMRGRHRIPGAPLEWLYGHPNDGFRGNPHGGWQKALNEFAWNAISFQPFDRHLHGKNKEFIAAFHADPEWQRIEKETEKDCKPLGAVEAFKMKAADFSLLK